MPASTIWLVIAIGLALPASGALMVVLAVFTGLHIGVGLLLLLVLDVAIVVGGYVAVRGSLAAADRHLCGR